jgi:N-carbamoylputrescine amidase
MGPLRLAGDEARESLRDVAGFYARAFGIPAVMANKAAGRDSDSPIPWVPLLRLGFHFVGQSTICDAEGNVCEQLDEREGVVVGEVALDPQRKRRPVSLPSGYWSRPAAVFPRFPRISAAVFRVLEGTGRAAYTLSGSRRMAARKCGGEKSSTNSTNRMSRPGRRRLDVGLILFSAPRNYTGLPSLLALQ